MKVLWTLAKVLLVLVIGVPVAIIALSTALGLLGALVGLAVVTLRLAFIGLCIWGAWRIAVMLFGGRSTPSPAQIREIARPVDPYYEAAKRELDQELGEARS